MKSIRIKRSGVCMTINENEFDFYKKAGFHIIEDKPVEVALEESEAIDEEVPEETETIIEETIADIPPVDFDEALEELTVKDLTEMADTLTVDLTGVRKKQDIKTEILEKADSAAIEALLATR